MASLKALKIRIGSVKSTQKITKAMKMVAAAKLRRAQANAEAGRPYSTRLAAVVASLASRVTFGPESPRLIAGTGSDQRHLIVVATGDRGLAGAFNTNIVRAARRKAALRRRDDDEVNLILASAREQLGAALADCNLGGQTRHHRFEPLGIGTSGNRRFLRAAQLRGGDHLHRLGDLLRRFDAADPHFKGFQGCHYPVCLNRQSKTASKAFNLFM